MVYTAKHNRLLLLSDSERHASAISFEMLDILWAYVLSSKIEIVPSRPLLP